MACRLVGIVNVTPDSFSDGGEALAPEAAMKRIEALAAEGAAVVDVGAESTRPGAALLTEKEEMERLAPLFALLRERPAPCALSLDTRHAATAAAGLEAGFAWINDVSGAEDVSLLRVVAASRAKYVLMHSLGVPADPKVTLPEEADVVEHLLSWGKEKLAVLAALGIAPERVIFDPGVGFGKTAAQSLAIMREAGRFKALGAPVMIGHSRKSWLAGVHAEPKERDEATVVASMALRAQGVDFLRVHNVALHARAFAEAA